MNDKHFVKFPINNDSIESVDWFDLDDDRRPLLGNNDQVITNAPIIDSGRRQDVPPPSSTLPLLSSHSNSNPGHTGNAPSLSLPDTKPVVTSNISKPRKVRKNQRWIPKNVGEGPSTGPINPPGETKRVEDAPSPPSSTDNKKDVNVNKGGFRREGKRYQEKKRPNQRKNQRSQQAPAPLRSQQDALRNAPNQQPPQPVPNQGANPDPEARKRAKVEEELIQRASVMTNSVKHLKYRWQRDRFKNEPDLTALRDPFSAILLFVAVALAFIACVIDFSITVALEVKVSILVIAGFILLLAICFHLNYIYEYNQQCKRRRFYTKVKIDCIPNYNMVNAISDDRRTDDMMRIKPTHNDPYILVMKIQHYQKLPKIVRWEYNRQVLVQAPIRIKYKDPEYKPISFELFCQLKKHSNIHAHLDMGTIIDKLNQHVNYISTIKFDRFELEPIFQNTVYLAAGYAKSIHDKMRQRVFQGVQLTVSEQ